jgi:sarcosine oxidase gamma subunit
MSTIATGAVAITGPDPIDALEYRSFAFPLVGTATAELPADAGSTQRDDAGRAALLHFAPGHFLAPQASPAMRRHLDALEVAGNGACFDVDGKWRHLAVTGTGAARLLAATIDVGRVLQHRECAAVTLFDCPAVLLRRADGYDVWVEASYATDFRAMLDRLSRRL